jgi:lipopolysaccharide export system ATP-binding protein
LSQNALEFRVNANRWQKEKLLPSQPAIVPGNGRWTLSYSISRGVPRRRLRGLFGGMIASASASATRNIQEHGGPPHGGQEDAVLSRLNWLAVPAGTEPCHGARPGRQRRPPGDAPRARTRLRVVGHAREPPTQLDSGRQLSLLIEDSADRIGLEFWQYYDILNTGEWIIIPQLGVAKARVHELKKPWRLSASRISTSGDRGRPLRDISVYLDRGECVALVGVAGSGKTALLRVLAGRKSAEKGTVTLDKADISRLPTYRRGRLGIGYLPQGPSIFRGLNVEQNVRAALEVIEPDRGRRDTMLDELLAEFGISHLRRTPARMLSGGECRRVEIARALATQPFHILLDEPLAGIDPIAMGEIRDLVRHLRDRGLGVLIADHDIDSILSFSDRVYFIYAGEILLEGRRRKRAAPAEDGKLEPGNGLERAA